jgi:hypothetical protein
MKANLSTFVRMKRFSPFSPKIAGLTTVFVLGVALALNAQDVKEAVLQDIKPTLSGHTNCAFVQMEKMGSKEMTVFWKKDEPGYELVTAFGGWFYGKNAGGKIGMSTIRFDATNSDSAVNFGGHGEIITFGEAHVVTDGDALFTGNLDYDESSYTFLGNVRLLKHTFSSDKKDPLVFKLIKDKGFMYVKGRGSVTRPDGVVLTFSAK